MLYFLMLYNAIQYNVIQHNAALYYDAAVRMGSDLDPLAVLDPNLRVRGVGALRVVDASAMPQAAITSNQPATRQKPNTKQTPIIQ